MDKTERKLVVWAAAAVLIVGILALAWYFAPGTGSGDRARQTVPSNLRQAPELGLKDFKGAVHRLGDMKESNLILIHFWAHWCPPCLEEIPKFAAFASAPEAAQFRLVAVSEDPTWDEAHKSLLSEGHPKNFISVIDPESKVSEVYGTYQYPETYAVRIREGRAEILMKWVGPQDWGGAEFSAALSRLATNEK